MARNITVLVKSSDGSKRAGIEVFTGTLKWVAADPDNDVYNNIRGTYRMVGTTFEMLKEGDSSVRVGRFVNFKPDDVQTGVTGNGLSDDKGLSITYKVDGILEDQ